jgi:hypothetical protein
VTRKLSFLFLLVLTACSRQNLSLVSEFDSTVRQDFGNGILILYPDMSIKDQKLQPLIASEFKQAGFDVLTSDELLEAKMFGLRMGNPRAFLFFKTRRDTGATTFPVTRYHTHTYPYSVAGTTKYYSHSIPYTSYQTIAWDKKYIGVTMGNGFFQDEKWHMGKVIWEAHIMVDQRIWEKCPRLVLKRLIRLYGTEQNTTLELPEEIKACMEAGPGTY